MTPVNSSIFLLARRRVPSYLGRITISYRRAILKRHCTYSSLGQLLCALVLGVLNQFHDTAFVGREAGSFADDAADESGALAKSLMSPANVEYK